MCLDFHFYKRDENRGAEVKINENFNAADHRPLGADKTRPISIEFWCHLYCILGFKLFLKIHTDFTSPFFFFFSFFLDSCIDPIGCLPWEIWVAFPLESQLQQSYATQPTVHGGCFIVSIIHRTLTWTTGSLTCTQMLMHAIVHGGVRTLKESLHWKLTLGEKSLAAARTGNRTCVGGVPVRCSTK